MKKNILYLLMFSLVSQNNIFAGEAKLIDHQIVTDNQIRPDTNILILDSLLAINLSYYIGRPVDSLLQVLPQSPKTVRITSADKPHIASRVIITYDIWYWIQIVVKDFQYMPVYDPNRVWDFNLFKNETISWIFVNRGNTCIYGCTGSIFRN